jgi:hypothetical protein
MGDVLPKAIMGWLCLQRKVAEPLARAVTSAAVAMRLRSLQPLRDTPRNSLSPGLSRQNDLCGTTDTLTLAIFLYYRRE